MNMIGVSQIEPLNDFLTSGDLYVTILLSCLLLILGGLQSFLGYKSFKVWCAFIGVVIGAVGGIMLVSVLIPSTEGYSGVLSIFFIVCLAVLGGFIAFRAYLVGLFIYAFAALFMLSFFALGSLDPIMIALIVGICTGIAAGVLAVIFHRICIILATCLIGGVCVAQGLMMLLENSGNVFLAVILPIIVGVLCLAGGFVVQWMTTKKKPLPVQPVNVTVTPAVAAAGGAVVGAAAAGSADASAPAATAEATKPDAAPEKENAEPTKETAEPPKTEVSAKEE